MRQEGYLDLLLGFQLGWNGTLLEGKLARGGTTQMSRSSRESPLLPKKNMSCPWEPWKCIFRPTCSQFWTLSRQQT